MSPRGRSAEQSAEISETSVVIYRTVPLEGHERRNSRGYFLHLMRNECTAGYNVSLSQGQKIEVRESLQLS